MHFFLLSTDVYFDYVGMHDQNTKERVNKNG